VRPVTLPERCQPLIRFGVAVTSTGGSNGGADRFAKFVTGRAQLATWARYGFVVTGSGAHDDLEQHRRAAE
jgi:ABC-type molybdate transport system substrate-binding protein